MKEQTRKWIALSDEDFNAAQVMLASRQYRWTIFLCHIATEKLLKGCVVEFADEYPPKIHMLVRLAEKADVTFPENLKSFVEEMSDKSIPTRYPEEDVTYTESGAHAAVDKTREVLEWLKQQLTSRAP
ncbi:MAG: HEPN domain-containing protein [Chloroflexi bacterium]|nr:HEPN domain-containing protein [Chloroflexota bacterium]MBI3760803.1 HEPN domain-containing protein [Chloroflexota bacterium]